MPTFDDGSTTGAAGFYSSSANFTQADLGTAIYGSSPIPNGATITSVIDSTKVSLSTNTGTATKGLHFSLASRGRSTFADGGTTNASTTFTSTAAVFNTATDAGKRITGTNIPAGATISSVTSATTVVLSAAATATGSGVTFTVENRFFLQPAVATNGTCTCSKTITGLTRASTIQNEAPTTSGAYGYSFTIVGINGSGAAGNPAITDVVYPT